MCKNGQFRCLETFDQIYEEHGDEPDAWKKWVEVHPCLKTCKQIRDLCLALETVLNLEEMAVYYRAVRRYGL